MSESWKTYYDWHGSPKYGLDADQWKLCVQCATYRLPTPRNIDQRSLFQSARSSLFQQLPFWKRQRAAGMQKAMGRSYPFHYHHAHQQAGMKGGPGTCMLHWNLGRYFFLLTFVLVKKCLCAYPTPLLETDMRTSSCYKLVHATDVKEKTKCACWPIIIFLKNASDCVVLDFIVHFL